MLFLLLTVKDNLVSAVMKKKTKLRVKLKKVQTRKTLPPPTELLFLVSHCCHSDSLSNGG